MHGTKQLAVPVHLSIMVFFDPETTIIGAVLLPDGNPFCILKTKDCEELEFTVQPEVRRQ